MSNQDIRKVSTHISQNEGLIFEHSSPGKRAYRLRSLDVPEVDAAAELGEALRKARGASVHLVGALAINRYGGREKPQLRLIDAAEVAD